MAELLQNNKTKRTKSSKFTSVPLELLTCKSVIIKSTGEEIPFTDTALRVYLYMRNRYCWVLDNKDQYQYFESWESIAKAVGKTKELFKGVSNNRPDKILTNIGLLKTEKMKGSRSVIKTVLDVVDIEDSVEFVSNITYNSVEPKKEVPKKVIFKEDPFEDVDDDEDLIPF